ncbi:MAG TPA: urease accessory UreF family protein [Stellaceae bacterium]|nr:urease accessory UreF family protein [Stellaceae bacterium]
MSALYRLLAWSSPAFPTGAFSYSHGIEAAAEDGTVRDRASLETWIAAIVVRGSGRIDADLLCEAYRAAADADAEAVAEAHRRGCAYRATAELALESAQQGAAFLTAYRAAWDPDLPASSAPVAGSRRIPETDEGACYAAAFGAAAARAGVALADALVAYLQALAANLMSAGLRLGLIGQSDGQRILAALEPAIGAAAAAAIAREPAAFGGASFAAELASMAHETQYSRLFRS